MTQISNPSAEDFAVLAHVVSDPQGWIDNANAKVADPLAAFAAKVEKHRADYDAVKDDPDYKTRAERDAVVPVPSVADIIGAIQAESERRISVGTVIGGSPFRTDTTSIARLDGLLKAAERAEAASQAFSATFRTEAGQTVTVTSAAEVGALFDAATAHVNAVLTASASLQATAPTDEVQRAAYDVAAEFDAILNP